MYLPPHLQQIFQSGLLATTYRNESWAAHKAVQHFYGSRFRRTKPKIDYPGLRWTQPLTDPGEAA